MRNMPMTVQAVAKLVDGTVEGDGSVTVQALAPLDSAGPADLTFADDRHAARLLDSGAGAAVVLESAPKPPRMALVLVKNVAAAVAKLLAHLAEPEDLPPRGVHPSAVIAGDATVSPDAAVGPGAVIGPKASVGPGSVLCANVFVGADAEIGRDCVLAEGVVVKERCVVGNRVRIGPNSVIGWDGFGYYTEGGVHHRVRHIGNVVVEDDVELGACTCVDRAKFGSTRIGGGTKIDNLVQVAHNVQIGRGCILAGQAGVAGSARLGSYVVIGGGSGVRDNITLGDGVQLAAHAAAAKDAPAGQTLAGTPAGNARDFLRMVTACKKLPDLIKQVKDLEARLRALESAKHD